LVDTHIRLGYPVFKLM